MQMTKLQVSRWHKEEQPCLAGSEKGWGRS